MEKNQQVSFTLEAEKEEAINYILNTPENVDFRIHEDNQNQGAWGPAKKKVFPNV